jgi:hypothetical protein
MDSQESKNSPHCEYIDILYCNCWREPWMVLSQGLSVQCVSLSNVSIVVKGMETGDCSPWESSFMSPHRAQDGVPSFSRHSFQQPALSISLAAPSMRLSCSDWSVLGDSSYLWFWPANRHGHPCKRYKRKARIPRLVTRKRGVRIVGTSSPAFSWLGGKTSFCLMQGLLAAAPTAPCRAHLGD